MPKPFSVDHFRAWAKHLVLDNGEPWKLEPFQLEFVADVFAGYRAVWEVVPEGNGKTTMVAGLGLYHLEFTEEASVPVAASSRQQAMILYGQAEGFVFRSPKLAVTDHWKCQPGYRRIVYLPQRSVMQVFAADDAHADGVIPTLAIVEELHRHKGLKLYDTWRGKSGKRDGQTVVISTAGEPGGEFERRREQIRQKADTLERNGSHLRAESPGLVLHEHALQPDEDPEDLEAVNRANPFSGITVDTLKAKFEAPDFNMNHWRRFTCNLPTRSDLAAIQEKEWFDAKTEDQIPDGEPVAVGLDLGWKHDTTAVVPLWVRDSEYRLLGPARILVPPRDGTFMEPERVKHALTDLHERNPIRQVVMDITDARELAEWLELTFGCEVVPMTQQIPMQVDWYKKFTEALRQGWLKHSGDEGLTQHVLNAVDRLLPGGDLVFSRPVSWVHVAARQDLRVIDGLIAAAMVHSVAAGELAQPDLADLLVV